MANYLLCITLTLSLLLFQSNGLYFYLSKGMKKCFKDDVIKYSVKFILGLLTYLKEIEAFVKLLDKEALDFVNSAQESAEQPMGVLLELFQPDTSMIGQYVKPEKKYIFNTTQSNL